MEEDIKILEDFFEDRMLVEEEKRALENLIHSVKYNVVPKYKIRKKIEELKKELTNEITKNDGFAEYREYAIDILEELMEDK